ncbi:hypothetical protein ABK040_010829 [Willaertia magna]
MSISSTIFHVVYFFFYYLEYNFPSNKSEIPKDLKPVDLEYHQLMAIKDLNTEEMALVRWCDLLMGKPQPFPEISDYFIDKNKSRETIIHDINELRDQSPGSIHAYHPGPFHSYTETIDFTGNPNPTKKSFFFDFSNRNKHGKRICLLEFHSGAYTLGNASNCYLYEKFCAKHGFSLLGVEYRLYPENTVEEAVEDGLKAYLWLIEQKKMEEIYLVGESSGGNLSILLMERIKDLDNRVKGCILFSPLMNLTKKGFEALDDIQHQDRVLQNKIIRLLKVNGSPCGVNHYEKCKELSPCFWKENRLRELVKLFENKGIFISYSKRERLTEEIELFMAKFLKLGGIIKEHTSNIPVHAFQVFGCFLKETQKDLEKRMLEYIEK